MNVIIEGPDGARRVAPQSGQLTPGERVVGVARDAEFDAQAASPRQKDLNRIIKYLDSIEAHGYAIGDKIAFLTAALGIEKCPRCQAWQMILNRVGELGWWRACKLMLAAARAARQARN